MRRFVALLTLALASGAALAQEVLSDEKFWEWEKDKITTAEHKERRDKVRAALPDNTALIVATNPMQVRSNDTDFQFRPDSNFWYLTGCEEPESIAIISKTPFDWGGKTGITEAVFVLDRNPGMETWTGYRLGPARAASVLGFQASFSSRDFEGCLQAMATAGAKFAKTPSILNAPYVNLLSKLGQVTTWITPVNEMRYIKSPAEIALIRRAAQISAMGHVETIRSCDESMREYDLQGLVEYMFKRGGCEFPAYGSIVGCGPNSTVLHYPSARRKLNAGEIICMDTAGEYHGYAADVTRSYPVSGKFSPEQKAIYEVVLAAQNAGINECRNGRSFGAPHMAAQKVITEGLLKLGVIKEASETRRYFMHGTSHTIGLDVHDTNARSTGLVPGVCLTVEPGIYIKAGSPCDKKWWNIGIRIEDDILVTEGEPENMSKDCPRTVAGIEALMAQKGIGNVPVKPAK